MTDNEKAQGSENAGSDDRPSDTSGPDKERIDEMAHGIERVDDEIDNAKEEAKKAEALDPQPMSGTEDAPNSNH